MEEEKKTKKENVLAGIVGAFLGSLIGVLCTVVIGQLGYVASVSGLVMAVCALKGYELLSGGILSKKGAAVSSVLVLVMTWFAHRLSWAVALASALDAGVFQCFQAIPGLLDSGMLEGAPYWGDLVMLYLFTLLGAVPTIVSGLRAASMAVAEFPKGTAAAGQEGQETDAVFYPGNNKWMRPLRLSAVFAMLLGLVPGAALAVMGYTEDYALAPLAAGLGCILSCFIMMFFALFRVQLCNKALLLLVRVRGTLWLVRPAMLNAADTYKFTKKIGFFQAIHWGMLNEEERERAKASTLRAIDLLSSGQVMAGSSLSLAVMPLADLQVVKESRWGWKCVYSAGNGKKKKISIPKAYPDLVLGPETEPAQGPVPADWGLLALALVMAAALGFVGNGIVTLAEGGAGYGRPAAATPPPGCSTERIPMWTPMCPTVSRRSI